MKKNAKPPKGARRASAIERFDALVANRASRYRETLPVRGAALIGKLADQPPLFAASAATIAIGVLARRPALLRTGIRMLASEAVATGIKAGIKHHIARTRPGKMRKDGRYALHADSDGDKDEGPWNSFPSGHTAGAVAVGRAVTREFPAAAPAAVAAAGTVAAVQVPNGAHFPSDVAVGAAVGWIAEALVDAVAVRVRRYAAANKATRR